MVKEKKLVQHIYLLMDCKYDEYVFLIHKTRVERT